jgi:hypothetical protein
MDFAMRKVLVQYYGLGIRFKDNANVSTPSCQETAELVYYHQLRCMSIEIKFPEQRYYQRAHAELGFGLRDV